MSRNWGGAPPWVYKQQQDTMAASYQDRIGRLEARIQELEAENADLKRRLEECLRGRTGSQDVRK